VAKVKLQIFLDDKQLERVESIIETFSKIGVKRTRSEAINYLILREIAMNEGCDNRKNLNLEGL